MAAADDKKRKKKEKKHESMKTENQPEHQETADLPIDSSKKTTKKNKKRKLRQQDEEHEREHDGLDHDKPRAREDKRSNERNKHSVVTDERFASVHFDPRFQRVPKKESKVPIDSRFARIFKDNRFASSSAPVDKRGRPKKGKEVNPLVRYYHNQDEEEREKDEGEEEDEERESGLEIEVLEDKTTSTDEDEEEDYNYDDDEDLTQSDISRYLLASHDDTPMTEQETHRLAVVNMDWDNIKAVDLYVAISSCLPKGGQILSVGIYPSEYGLKCMEVEAVRGPSALIENNENHSDAESESEDEDLLNEKLRGYELNKLRYYHGVVVFDSSATANHVYTNLDGTELLRTSNVFDLRFVPDSMEFKHPPRDIVTEAPANYSRPDFLTRALQHSKVKLTWEEDEPHRTKTLRRKFNPDQLDELNEYLASSDTDADDGDGDRGGSENEDAGAMPNGKSKKQMDGEKLRALLLSGDGWASDKDDNGDQDMEITFNTGLEDLSKHILEKKEKKTETVWEQVLRKRSEKRKARKNRSKPSSEDDSSDSDVQEAAAEQPDDFFMGEDRSDSDTEVDKRKEEDLAKSKRGKGGQKVREESSDMDEEQEASRAELELLFAEDQDGKAQSVKGYKLKPKKGKGNKGKEVSVEAKLPDVDPSTDPRFSALFTSHLYALDPTDPQYKRSAAYARQQLGKRRTAKETEEPAETKDASEQIQNGDSHPDPVQKDRHELSSTVRSLKRNLGNLKKGTKSR